MKGGKFESDNEEEEKMIALGQHGQTSSSTPYPLSPPPISDNGCQMTPLAMAAAPIRSNENTSLDMPSSNNQRKKTRRGCSEEVLRSIRRDARRNAIHDLPPPHSTGESTLTKLRRKMCQYFFRHWQTYFSQQQRQIRGTNLRHYCQKHFWCDVVAGLTVGVMVVPQGMSYAKLAGLPVQYGLYGALFPVWAYAVFGSSRQLAVGPVAIVSLMLESGLSRIVGASDNDANSALYENLAIQTSLLVAITYILLGLFRLGFVTVFLSHAVTSGFTTGASVIIGCSQLKYILGYDVPRSDVLHEMIKNFINGIGEFNYKTFLMGGSSLVVLVVLKYLGRRYPNKEWIRATGPLFVSSLSILVTYLGDLSEKGLPIVGTIPRGFPSCTAKSWFPLTHFGDLIGPALGIAVVGFMESIAVAKQLASRHKYDLDSSTELIGLGMANLAGAIFQSYPVTGSLSRSAVNDDAGAKSRVSGIVTATLVGLVLLFLTSVFFYMPLSVLAAIVISGVSALFDYGEAIYLWSVHKFDFFVWCAAFLGTMFLGVEIGLAIAVVLSLGIVLFESAYPHTAVLGRLLGTSTYRSVRQYPDVTERYDGIVIVRVDAPLFFANAQHVREKMWEYVDKEEERFHPQQQRGAGGATGLNVDASSTEREHEEKIDDFEDNQDPLVPVQGRRRCRSDITTQPSFSDATNSSDCERKIQFIILDLSPVARIDTTALHILSDMNDSFIARDVTMCLSNPTKIVMQRLIASGLDKDIGRGNIFVDTHYAVESCLEKLAQSSVSGEIFQGERDGLSSTSSSIEPVDVDGNYHLLL